MNKHHVVHGGTNDVLGPNSVRYSGVAVPPSASYNILEPIIVDIYRVNVGRPVSNVWSYDVLRPFYREGIVNT